MSENQKIIMNKDQMNKGLTNPITIVLVIGILIFFLILIGVVNISNIINFISGVFS